MSANPVTVVKEPVVSVWMIFNPFCPRLVFYKSRVRARPHNSCTSHWDRLNLEQWSITCILKFIQHFHRHLKYQNSKSKVWKCDLFLNRRGGGASVDSEKLSNLPVEMRGASVVLSVLKPGNFMKQEWKWFWLSRGGNPLTRSPLGPKSTSDACVVIWVWTPCCCHGTTLNSANLPRRSLYRKRVSVNQGRVEDFRGAGAQSQKRAEKTRLYSLKQNGNF